MSAIPFGRCCWRDAEGPEKILRQHGRVPDQPGLLPEDGGPGRVQPVPGRVRTGERPRGPTRLGCWDRRKGERGLGKIGNFKVRRKLIVGPCFDESSKLFRPFSRTHILQVSSAVRSG